VVRVPGENTLMNPGRLLQLATLMVLNREVQIVVHE
jgi:hypothetical protein